MNMEMLLISKHVSSVVISDGVQRTYGKTLLSTSSRFVIL